MFYPRKTSELSVVWGFFESFMKHREERLSRGTTLHVGYKIHRPNHSGTSPIFTSVDKKLNITHEANRELFMPHGSDIDGFVLRAMGPALCANEHVSLESCLPRDLKLYTVCTVDFNAKNDKIHTRNEND